MPMYKGKEPCQGCGKSGADRQRAERDRLCEQCQKEIETGRIFIFESKIEYVNVFQHHYAFHVDELNKLVHKILSSADNPNVKYAGGIKNIKYSSGSNGTYYKVDSRLVEPITDLLLFMEHKYLELDKQIKALPIENRNALNMERDVIFSQGVEHGKKLLLQLNAGDISMSDFDKTVYKRNDT